MRHSTLATSLVVLAVAVVPARVEAQPFDHLKCYKVKDAGKYDAVVDLHASLNPPFAPELGCKVKLKAKELCVPVEKTIVQSTAPGTNVVGPEAVAYVCYKAKCPKPAVAIPAVLVSDQFSSRDLSKFKAKKLCAPAVEGLPPTTTTSTSTTVTTTTTAPCIPSCVGKVCGDDGCGGSCGACGGGQGCCSFQCVDLGSDPNNCGSCGAVCSAPNTACAGGSCQCVSGFMDCDGSAITGCEVDVLTSSNHCGACNNACTGGDSCQAGVCMP